MSVANSPFSIRFSPGPPRGRNLALTPSLSVPAFTAVPPQYLCPFLDALNVPVPSFTSLTLPPISTEVFSFSPDATSMVSPAASPDAEFVIAAPVNSAGVRPESLSDLPFMSIVAAGETGSAPQPRQSASAPSVMASVEALGMSDQLAGSVRFAASPPPVQVVETTAPGFSTTMVFPSSMTRGE